MPTVLARPKADEIRSPALSEELLADITRRIVDKFHPYRVILFGSYAWGRPHDESDVDIAVIMDAKSGWDVRSEVSSEASVPHLPMDVLVYTPAEIETRLAMGDFFVQNILDRGRILYSNYSQWDRIEVHPTLTLLEEWIGKAESNYQAASYISRRRKDPMPGIVVIHCQQSVEKYLKAVIMNTGKAPDKRHKLEELLKECVTIEPSLAAFDAQVKLLDKFSVDPRYPGFTASMEQAEDGLAACRAIRRAVRKLIESRR